MSDTTFNFLCLLGAVVILGLFVFAGQFVGVLQCSAKWQGSGMESRYVWFAGCQVKSNGAWVPERNYRVL